MLPNVINLTGCVNVVTSIPHFLQVTQVPTLGGRPQEPSTPATDTHSWVLPLGISLAVLIVILVGIVILLLIVKKKKQ